MSKENKQLNIAFVHNGTDEEIIKSMANDEEHEYSNEELHKAMDKAKLVQKEVSVQGKNGQTFTRKQWVRTGEEVKQPQDTKKQEEVKEKTTSSTNKSGKQQVAEMLTSGKSKTDIMAEFEKQGVTWKKNDHEGINWMRAAMAMNKHFENGRTFDDSDVSSSQITQKKQDLPNQSKSSNSVPTKDKPLVTSETKSGRPYSLWQSGSKIYGSIPGKEDSHNARDIRNWSDSGFNTLDEVKDYIKKYF